MNIKKVLQGVALGAVCGSMALSLAGCNGGGTRDTETHPVTLAIGALDGNYNPFFYTAQNDGEVTGLTQVSLVGADGDANIVCGQNEPTVALAYRETVAADNSETKFEYVIKKGVKFSDGEDLTIKDVLFNFYVFLDPYYTGSSTLYSTKIKGLAQYRTQLEDGDAEDATNRFTGLGRQRLVNLENWDSRNPIATTPQIEADAVKVANLLMEYLETAWNNSVGTAGSYSESYSFTEDWEVFYYNTSFVSIQRDYDAEGKYVRWTDANGKYVMTFDSYTNILGEQKQGSDYGLRRNMERVLEGLSGEERQEAMKKEAIDTIFSSFIRATYDEDGNIKTARAATTGTLNDALDAYVGSEALQAFINDEMSIYYNGLREKGELAFTSIEGIKADTVTAASFGTSFTAGSPLDPNETYDRLTITLDGVDPVAKYNFGITISPMHYYSGTVKDADGVDVDYIERAMTNNPDDEDVADRFGVKYADSEFFDNVLKIDSFNKSSKPVGAGPYMICKTNADGRLEINKECKYERNPYFESLGTGIENANIKYLTYRYISDDQLVSTLEAGNVDFGTPQCTTKNIDQLSKARNIVSNQYDANGFGYVGINPKFVPDIEIRRIIMSVMDVADITATYYDNKYAQVITRPITTNSWVYVDGIQPESYYEYDTNSQNILAKLRALGYKQGDDGVYAKGNNKLKYTFTIAGETSDHPAFRMFKNAEAILNESGFDITVVTDINALQKLAMGNLTVWAAAWTSGIDPDMYQVYHMDSKASSVRNWGYDVILSNESDYPTEYDIIVNELSPLIERGRSYTTRDARRPIYQDALNKVMELAVELPTYQRKDMYAYNASVIDGNSLYKNINAYEGPLNRIWELNYVK